MSTYYINFYPKGLMGNEPDPAAYAYADDAFPPQQGGIRLRVTVPDEPTTKVEVVK